MKPATVTTQYEAMRGIFDLGDKVEIEIVYYDRDTTLVNERTRFDGKSGKHIVVSDAVIAQKGSYKNYRIKSKNGNYYDEACIRNFIGYKSLGEIFTLDK